MRIPYLLTIIIFSPSLHGMQGDWTLYKALKNTSPSNLKTLCYQQHNIDTYGNIINVAQELNDGPLMANLIQLCLPPELVQKHITPHLAQHVATEYRHALISHKLNNNYCTIKNIDHRKQWKYVSHYDGSYSVVPKTDHTYTLWKENKSDTARRICFFDDNKLYWALLRSTHNNKRLTFASLDTENPYEQNKNFLLQTDTETISMVVDYPLSHQLLSNDSTLLACGFRENNEKHSVIIMDTKTQGGVRWKLNGSVNVLCAAHHSPLFVIGSNRASTSELPNLCLFITWAYQRILPGHNAPITCAEFNPDDTRLLTSSYDKKENKSITKLWDARHWGTQYYGKIKCIRTLTHPINPLCKAFFICNGEKIIIVYKSGGFGLLDGLTGKSVEKKCTPVCAQQNFVRESIPKIAPLIIGSSKNQLIISTYHTTIQCHSSQNGAWLGTIPTDHAIAQIGLTTDENTIIFMDNDENAYQLSLYSDEEVNDINFIANYANIVQLYTLLNIHAHNKKIDKATTCVEAIKSYIQEHQKYHQAFFTTQ